MMKRAAPFVGALASLFLFSCGGNGGGETGGSPLRLMTFNIRYGTAEDGANSWGNRRDLVAEMIRREAPDVLALQEALSFQMEELAGALTGFEKLGQHREGGEEGEFSGLLVNRARVSVVDWGEFWLSPMPDSVGSRGWDAALPRMAVWADVTTRDGGGPVRIYGTHFDHQGETARVESARLLARHAMGGPPSVIMGDLNAGEDSDPLLLLFLEGYRSAVLVSRPNEPMGTFNGFQDASGGERIDHILVGPGLGIVRGEILGEQDQGRWPSDHFPVVAEVTLTTGG